MTLTWPWMLIALGPVALAAFWALWRPMRQTATVPSLSLWREALESLTVKGRRRRRRVRAQWLYLLCGAAVAAVALARPTIQFTLGRRVNVAVYPSAEFAGDDGAGLRNAAERLFGRLSATDRVRLILPDVLGGRTEMLSPAEARRRINELPILPVRADDLSVRVLALPGAPAVMFAPAGTSVSDRGDVSLVELPTDLPAATVDQVGAAAMPDGGVQVFVAVRNHTAQSAGVTIRAVTLDTELSHQAGGIEIVTVPAGERAGVTLTLSAGGEVVVVTIFSGANGGPLDYAYLVRRPVTIRKVAMVGEDNPFVRRYISADESLELVAAVDDADIIIANGTSPAGAKPALIFGAAVILPLGADVDILQHVELSGADVAADHPVMAGVDLTGAAVRELPVWRRSAMSIWYNALAGVDGGAFIVVDEANRPGSAGSRAVYVLPDLAAENTNWMTLKSFVIFMANTMHWLAPGQAGGGEYVYRAPIDVGRPADWKPVAVTGRADDDTGPLLRPGVYVDSDGALHALSLVALRVGAPKVPAAQAVDAADLGETVDERMSLEVWPLLVGAAGLLWLAGWTLRVVR